MRRPLLAVTLIAVALATGACSASAAPGWTYAAPTPAPAITPAPSGGASGAPSAAAGEPTPVPGGQSPAAGGAVQISAVNVAFDQKEVSAPAGAPFTIHFDNKDGGIPHNVEIKDAAGMVAFKGDVITGPSQVDYLVPAQAAGTYQFVCTVHPNMVGTLKVGG